MQPFSAKPMTEPTWYVYLLECRSGRIYTGVTPDPARRMALHRTGKGARFTRSDHPEHLLATKPFANRREAQRVEYQVKRLSAATKRLLAQRWSQEYPIDQLAQEALALDE
jgi:putative endonuclease